MPTKAIGNLWSFVRDVLEVATTERKKENKGSYGSQLLLRSQGPKSVAGYECNAHAQR